MLECQKEGLKDCIEFWEDEDCVEDKDVMVYSLKEYIELENDVSLYRYMPPSYYAIRNLETQTVHLSSVGAFNDIFEGLPYDDIVLEKSDLQGIENMAFVSCFTEKRDNLLMWSHYADSHRGFCVKYNPRLLLTPNIDEYDDILRHLFPVIYSDKKVVARRTKDINQSVLEMIDALKNDYEYDDVLDLDDILPLMLVKSSDWSYEDEWRIIYSICQIYDSHDELWTNRNISFPCISEVYLGFRMNSEHKEHIIEICRRLSTEIGREIKVFQTNLQGRIFELEFKEIQYQEESYTSEKVSQMEALPNEDSVRNALCITEL